MIEYQKNTLESTASEPSEDVIDSIAQAYLMHGMESVCTGFGDADDPMQAESAAENIVRQSLSNPSDYPKVQAIINQANKTIDAMGGVDSYLDEMVARRKRAAETNPPDSTPHEYSAPTPEIDPREQSVSSLGESAVARFFRGKR